MLRYLILGYALTFMESNVSGVDFFFGGGVLAVILAHPLIADFKGMLFHQRPFFSNVRPRFATRPMLILVRCTNIRALQPQYSSWFRLLSGMIFYPAFERTSKLAEQ